MYSAISCRFSDRQPKTKILPIHVQNSVDFPSSLMYCYQGLTLYRACFFVNFLICSPQLKTHLSICKTMYISIFTDALLQGAIFIHSVFHCRFSKWQPRTKKSTYPYVNDCRLSQITYVLQAVEDFIYSAISCRFSSWCPKS